MATKKGGADHHTPPPDFKSPLKSSPFQTDWSGIPPDETETQSQRPADRRVRNGGGGYRGVRRAV